ncbi:PP2C family protein-serine/threonine phosphatase [Streptomyces virginiae]|uniref:PP2C family protein-serine/threonine phosphatase n=1 Tax=Streptomyces virginiae TaxID=1961 RepID=UPI003665F5E0
MRIRAAGAHSLLVAPLALRGHVLGLVSLYRTGESPPFSRGDLGLVREVSAHTALCVDNARRFTREHTIAATVQRHLLPRHPVGQSTVETAHLHVPGDGGDGGWFDAIPLSGARTALIVGNVSGHGIHTATTMGQLRTVVHALAALDLEPDELLARLDDTTDFLAAERAARPVGDHAHPQPLYASCLYAAALDAHIRHFDVTIAPEAVAYIDAELAQAALGMMEANKSTGIRPLQDMTFETPRAVKGTPRRTLQGVPFVRTTHLHRALVVEPSGF